MKKTLIAVAAAALSMGAMAQNVTLSGKFGAGFGKGIGGANNWMVTDGDVRFTANEDLGGGLKATASMEVRVRGRANPTSIKGSTAAGATDPADTGNKSAMITGNVASSSVDGRNATLGLSGGFGSLTLGAVEAGNGIIGLGFAGAPVALVTGYDGAILSGASNVDWANYTSPALLPGLTAKLERFDSVGGPGNSKGTAGNVVGVNYGAGAIAAAIDYTRYNNDTNRKRLSGSYDLGIAKLGVGMEDNSASAGQQIAFGARVPMGAVTLGLIYGKNEESKAADGKAKTGWGVGMDYALSKRTTFNVSYGDQTNGAANNNGDQYRLRLLHTF